MTDKRPMQVQCVQCGHVWTAAYLPMEMGKVATLLKRVMCPMCAAGVKDLFLLQEKIADI
jgi:formate dehydrogenase maturation protein FdhE